MQFRLAIAPILILALAGCHSDEKPAAELTGKLHNGHVQGVAWRTPTRSGTTDGNGRFTYLPGETVTFSIGEVELGAAPGSADITLFTLAGMTPPTTERALRRALDLAMRTRTPFTRAINLDVFLLALDADGNPDNGLDVRNREAGLKGISLNFDQRIGDFGGELFASVPELIQSIPAAKPVVHLYASLGLHIPVHAQTRVETDRPAQLMPGVQTYHYRADGLLESEDADRDGDGVFESHTGYEYDSFGRVTRLDYSDDFDLDGAVDQRYSSDYRFDPRGKVLGFVQTSESVGFGPPQTATLVERVEDEFGRPTRQVVDFDTNGDGSADSRQTGTAEFDASRTRSKFTSDSDSGNDGIVDARTIITETYDTRRRVLSSTIEYDYDADGVVDSRDTEVIAYDDVARTVRETIENDSEADGTADWRTVLELRLDRAGNVIAQSQSIEPLGDGVASQSQTITREFDDARRVTNSTRDEDINGDRIADSRQLDTTTYDELGNVTWTTSDYDVDVDGNLDVHFDEGSEYGPDGELLASAAHYDFNGDGFTDVRNGTTVTNEVVDDGVLLLTNWFFRTRFSGFQ